MMKSVKVFVGGIVLVGAAIALTVGGTSAIVGGINQLGLRFWGDQSLICLNRREKLNAIAVTADGKQLVTGSQAIRIWDIATGQKQYDSTLIPNAIDQVMGLNPPTIHQLAITPDQRLLVSAVAIPGVTDYTHEIQIWDLGRRQVLRSLRGHGDRIGLLVITPDSRTLVSQDDRGVVNIWDLATGQVKQSLTSAKRLRSGMVLSPDRTRFVTIDNAGIVTLRDMATGQVLASVKADPSHTPLALSAGNQTLLIQNAGDVKRFINLATGAVVQTIQGSYVEAAIAPSPNGERVFIATATDIALHDLKTGKVLQRFNMPNFYGAIAVAPNNQLFLTITSNGQYDLWDLTTGSKRWSFSGRSGLSHGFGANSTLVSADRAANDITWWNWQTGQRIRKICNG